MGTDRVPRYRGPCKCGAGEFVVMECTPDHPWGGPTWLEETIACDQCQQQYALIQQGGQVVVVRRTEVDARERLLEERSNRLKALVASSGYRAIMEQAERRLAGLPSMAARYRDLPEELRGGVEGTFRRNVQSAGGLRRWLENRIGTLHLPELMLWLGVRDPDIEQQLQEAQALWNEAYLPLPTLGPLCDAVVP